MELLEARASMHHVNPKRRCPCNTVVRIKPKLCKFAVTRQAVDSRSDIFALGAVLYEVLTGQRAFDKPTAAETMSAIVDDDPSATAETCRAHAIRARFSFTLVLARGFAEGSLLRDDLEETV